MSSDPELSNQSKGYQNLNRYQFKLSIRYIPFLISSMFLVLSVYAYAGDTIGPSGKKIQQRTDLDLIFKVLPPDQLNENNPFDDRGRISFYDRTFNDWLDRTGELPPDYNSMPSIPFLPDPLIIDEGGRNIRVKTATQWQEKRAWMKKQLQHYITGTYPPPPANLTANVLSERIDGKVTIRMVELKFGPEQKAKLTLELMIPPGDGPFPVFLTQWNHREWAQLAVRRGYIGCIYAGADTKDDTESYSEIWAGQYDFTRLMRRAWGASRAIDYLHTLTEVDPDKIGLTGHSRNAKTSIMAAAFDERIAAVVSSSGCTGAEVPWRYTAQNYDIEDIALLASARPSWLHPRLRFFIGREHKLPVDQNSFMALIAPRGLMLATALTEGAANIWAIEQNYQATHKVYDFLKSPQNLAIRTRYGEHGVSAREMEIYIDFFDYVFKRSNRAPENKLYTTYTFDEWCNISGEEVNLTDFPEIDPTHNSAKDKKEWESKKAKIQEQIKWVLGNEPPGVTNPGPKTLQRAGRGEVSFGTFLTRPRANKTMGVMPISPYNGFGDQLFGYLYYPLNENGEVINKNLPVVIYLHEFDYSKGFNSYHRIESMLSQLTSKGFAVFTYDMLGFGNRIEEATEFYNRYPQWSKMGKMVTDVKGAVDALSNLDFINSEKIIVAGYSVGAVAGLYAAATDTRIAGVVSVAGFTPMRTNTIDRGTEGIKTYSHLHGLQPRLGFFVNNETRIPVDFEEIIASVAPRPVLIIAPEYDKDAHLQDIKDCIDSSTKIYSLYNAEENLNLNIPFDINRFSPEMKDTMAAWLTEKFK